MLKEFKLFVYNKTRVFSFVIAWKPSIILFSCFFFHRFRSFRSIELVDVQMIKISFVLAHRLIDDDRRVYCSSLLFAYCRLDYHFFLYFFFVGFLCNRMCRLSPVYSRRRNIPQLRWKCHCKVLCMFFLALLLFLCVFAMISWKSHNDFLFSYIRSGFNASYFFSIYILIRVCGVIPDHFDISCCRLHETR